MSLTYQNMKRAVKIVIAAGNVPNIADADCKLLSGRNCERIKHARLYQAMLV